MTGVSIHLLFIYIHIVRKDKGLTRISTHFINLSFASSFITFSSLDIAF